MRHCCFRCVLSFLASLSIELQKARKAFGSPSTPGQQKFHYSEPSKQFYYSESRLLMDYPFEKLIGGMFLKKGQGFSTRPCAILWSFFLRNRFAFQLGSCWWCSGGGGGVVVVVVVGAWQLQLRELV